jgi:transcriptional regulator with XRE-family HTH domain
MEPHNRPPEASRDSSGTAILQLPLMGASPPIRRQLANILRTRREELHLSQEAAAAQCEMSPRYLRSLESGRSAVSMETLGRLLTALDWTWTDIAEKLAPEKGEALAGSAAVHRLLDRLWSNASPREREVIKRMLASFQ